MIDWARIVGFDWDAGNQLKSVEKHAVANAEAEQIFANRPLLIWEDSAHSSAECRFQALGSSAAGRWLFAVFTLRNDDTLIRIISVRDMKRRERHRYAQETQADSAVPQRS